MHPIYRASYFSYGKKGSEFHQGSYYSEREKKFHYIEPLNLWDFLLSCRIFSSFAVKVESRKHSISFLNNDERGKKREMRISVKKETQITAMYTYWEKRHRRRGK